MVHDLGRCYVQDPVHFYDHTLLGKSDLMLFTLLPSALSCRDQAR
jgi:hypothetical protein